MKIPLKNVVSLVDLLQQCMEPTEIPDKRGTMDLWYVLSSQFIDRYGDYIVHITTRSGALSSEL